ncbi:transposase [Phytopseudomonas seleniipraecipitans]|uniref:transposase n=1 Tax=Phytopseudomonas seleniipraecipitans TaxID=640205 RepID=UPI003B849981
MVSADKCYDSDVLIETIQQCAAQTVIPARRHRLNPRPLDRRVYRVRNLVERYFQKLKQFRRIATRYGRLTRNYRSMLSLVSAVTWLA